MEEYRTILNKLLLSYPQFIPLRIDIEKAYELIVDCYTKNGIVLTCGNGGSASDAEHIVGELMKGFRLKRKLPEQTVDQFLHKDTNLNNNTSPDHYSGVKDLFDDLQGALPAISLVSQSSLISAYSNDINPQMAYAQQVYAYGAGREALLIALSTSGNSKNIVNAVQIANCLGMNTIGITGKNSSVLDQLCTICIKTPAEETFEVQELTLPVYHALCSMVEAHFFEK